MVAIEKLQKFEKKIRGISLDMLWQRNITTFIINWIKYWLFNLLGGAVDGKNCEFSPFNWYVYIFSNYSQ